MSDDIKPDDVALIARRVLDGGYDQFLDALAEAIARRRTAKRLALEVMNQVKLTAGDKVRLSSTVRPKYVANAMGVFVGADRDKPQFARVKLTEGHVIVRARRFLDHQGEIKVAFAAIAKVGP